FRTRKLSRTAPMVLGCRRPGRVGRRRISQSGPAMRGAIHVSRPSAPHETSRVTLWPMTPNDRPTLRAARSGANRTGVDNARRPAATGAPHREVVQPRTVEDLVKNAVPDPDHRGLTAVRVGAQIGDHQ